MQINKLLILIDRIILWELSDVISIFNLILDNNRDQLFWLLSWQRRREDWFPDYMYVMFIE
jgi:hypothetical protein